MPERQPLLGLVGVVFIGVAAVGAWSGSGHSLDHQALRIGLPSLLIVLGLVAIALGRRR